jgi:hypothetical protein
VEPGFQNRLLIEDRCRRRNYLQGGWDFFGETMATGTIIQDQTFVYLAFYSMPFGFIIT